MLRRPGVGWIVWIDASGEHKAEIRKWLHLPAARKRVTWLRSRPGVVSAAIVSMRGRQMDRPRRRNNPHLRDDGDQDLPSTLTRSLPPRA